MVLDRFGQISPKLIFVCRRYRFAVGISTGVGRSTRSCDLCPASSIPSSLVPAARRQGPRGRDPLWRPACWPRNPAGGLSLRAGCLGPSALDSLLIGTTGVPKAVVHGHTGILVEHLKLMHFHLGLRPDARLFFYSTAGWMMWNVLVAALLAGSTAVLYDGSPVHPGPDRLWLLAEERGRPVSGQVRHLCRLCKRTD